MHAEVLHCPGDIRTLCVMLTVKCGTELAQLCVVLTMPHLECSRTILCVRTTLLSHSPYQSCISYAQVHHALLLCNLCGFSSFTVPFNTRVPCPWIMHTRCTQCWEWTHWKSCGMVQHSVCVRCPAPLCGYIHTYMCTHTYSTCVVDTANSLVSSHVVCTHIAPTVLCHVEQNSCSETCSCEYVWIHLFM